MFSTLPPPQETFLSKHSSIDGGLEWRMQEVDWIQTLDCFLQKLLDGVLLKEKKLVGRGSFYLRLNFHGIARIRHLRIGSQVFGNLALETAVGGKSGRSCLKSR